MKVIGTVRPTIGHRIVRVSARKFGNVCHSALNAIVSNGLSDVWIGRLLGNAVV